MENDSQQEARVLRWIRYGFGFGLAGILFFGIICGPIAIYFGVRSRRAASAMGALRRKTMAVFVIALGVFDIFFFLIMFIGAIRVIGGRG